jgi:hypothetical protein
VYTFEISMENTGLFPTPTSDSLPSPYGNYWKPGNDCAKAWALSPLSMLCLPVSWSNAAS